MAASSTSAKRVVPWLRRRASAWRDRPLLAATAAGFIAAWALRIPAQHGSAWDSKLAGAAWILLVCCAVIALVGGRPSNRSE